MKIQCVFIDRDGVLNFDSGYPALSELLISSPAMGFLSECTAKGIKVIVVTNQSGIARGILSEQDVLDVNSALEKSARDLGGFINGFFFCPHHPDFPNGKVKLHCDCRKPKPGLIHRAARDHNVDLRRSVMIGDKASDIDAGLSSGIPAKQCFRVSSVSMAECFLSFEDSLLRSELYFEGSVLN